MSGAVPRTVLSDAVREKLDGRTVVAAVFCTFRFDPGFFELEILPLLFDLQLHHDSKIRRLQLEEALRHLAGRVAVYYDPRALEEGGAGPAVLDVRRVPVRHRTGYFHPKNVLVLVEDATTGERSLIVVTGSANLTQAGWWENVECAHIEELSDGARSAMREDLLAFLSQVRRSSRLLVEDGPVETVRQFVRRLQPVPYRSAQGVLHTRFLVNGRRGGSSFTQILDGIVRGDLVGADLEIISPYLDDADASKPLEELLDLIQPRKWMIHLPERAGAARCREVLFDWVQANGGDWGRLPGALTSTGATKNAVPRRVHAKVYRIFTADRELVVMGSFNLTRAAHQATGNVETGVLVEASVARRPRFWLEKVEKRPAFADVANEDEGTDEAAIPLVVRYHWDAGWVEVLWDGTDRSPFIEAFANGVLVFTVTGLAAGDWTRLPAADAEALAKHVRSTSYLTLRVGSRQGVILVMEEGMAYRPSLLLDLTPADILRYWSLLTAEQRAAAIAEHGEGLADFEGVERLPMPQADATATDSIFDRHAGIFHAFGSLGRSVTGALADGRDDLARFRMFGAKYDSLPVLVERLAEGTADDLLDRYLMLLCARQLAERIRRDWREFWAGEPAGAARLQAALAVQGRLRAELASRNDESMADFLDWYEPLFLREAVAA